MKNLHNLLITGLLVTSYTFADSNSAQQHQHSHTADEDNRIVELSPIVVSSSATPKSIYDTIAPVSILKGDSLKDSYGSTIGEMLSGVVGVHGTSFSAGASRPIIRGFDGARIKLLQNGTEILDVSDTSPDHAASVDAIFAKSVEVVRGPATLLYGSSAIGGVINIIDSRVATEMPVSDNVGSLFLEWDSVSEGFTGAALSSNALSENLVVTVSALQKEHNDYEIPVAAESEALLEAEHHDHDDEHGDEDHDDDEEEATDRLENSFVDTQAYSISASWFPAENSRLSFTVSSFDSQYGISGHEHHHEDEYGHEDEHEHDDDHEDEDDHDHDHEGEHEHEENVTIDLKQKRFVGEWEQLLEGDIFKKINVKASYSDYEHREIEGDTVGTAFSTEGIDARLSANYLLQDQHHGILGVEIRSVDFDADGAEAFTPASTTNDLSAFVLQEWIQDSLSAEIGGRIEKRSVGDVSGHEDVDETALSLSGGVRYELTDHSAVSLAVRRSQRNPTATELFAHGPHLATRQFEIGNENLGVETATGFDLTYSVDSEWVSAQITGFHTRFDDYIYQHETGEIEDGLEVYQFVARDAEFNGLEAELIWHAIHGDEQSLHVTATFDMVNAELSDSGKNLPRIPPKRFGLKLNYLRGDYRAALSAKHALEQDDVAEHELNTEAYTDVTATFGYHLPIESMHCDLVVQVRNLLDDEIRHHTSFLKDEVPQPGRSFVVSLRTSW